MALDPALQELVDKAAIRDLMARYARGVDGLDSDMIASTFASDAYANYGQDPIPEFQWEGRGRDNIVRWITTRPRSGRPTHFMGDQVIQINGDTAEVETYAVGYGVANVDGTQSLLITGLRYVDKMVRQNGQWLVQHRVLHHDWRGNAPADASLPSPDRVPVSE